MALLFSPCSFLQHFPLNFKRATILHSFSSNRFLSIQCSATPDSFPFPFPRYSLEKTTLTCPLLYIPASSFTGTKITDFDSVVDELDSEEEDLAASPWEGAVVYRRDSSVTHVEYWTTLERLGLARLSTGLSRSRASAMGIRIPARRAKESGMGNETPVLVSIDVSRRKRRLKLDGILRTVLSLGCNRCAEPAAESVFSNFALLLTENPAVEEERDKVNMDKVSYEMEEEDEKLIDEDDRLYYPPEAKEIDISKHIRDLIHVEITLNAICSPNCKGLCLKCGTNLNLYSPCRCGAGADRGTKHGPLGDLGRQMQS